MMRATVRLLCLLALSLNTPLVRAENASRARNAMGDVTRLDTADGHFSAEFKRDAMGLELERTLPGGVRARWKRDQLGRPLDHELTSGLKTLRARSYTWDVNDRLRLVVDAMQGPIQYRHDALGNLAGARYPDGTVDLRLPDAVGNLFKREDRRDRKYGPAGQLLEAHGPKGVTFYSYDPEGNLIEKEEPGRRVWKYQWNAAGMLAKVTRPDGREVTFTYDALGRRIKKTYRGKTTHWVWDGNVPLHEWVEVSDPKAARENEEPTLDANVIALSRRDAQLSAQPAQGPPGALRADQGTLSAPITWLFEPESFSPLGKLVGEERFAIVTDHLGTPVSMTDARGAEVWAAEIDTYGPLRELRGERSACPFRWPGQYEDVETGLHYNRFRYYDADAGQYVAQDPIGLEGGFAPYGYARDTLTWSDPLGLKSCAERQQAMLDKNVGYNVSPEEWFQNYSHLGRYGTFVTDKKAFSSVLGHARPGKYTVGRTAGKGRVSRKQARDLERSLGLEPGSLNNGFRITKVEGIRDMSPRSPLEGNRFFLGPGKGLPGGGPEMVIDPVPT